MSLTAPNRPLTESMGIGRENGHLKTYVIHYQMISNTYKKAGNG